MPDSDRPEKLDYVRGDATGLDIPAHPAALRAVGENFLTQALQVFGALAPGNCIIRITRCEPCPGGSTGPKLFLSVEYLHANEKSEERRVGKECVRTCVSRWSPYHSQKNIK